MFSTESYTLPPTGYHFMPVRVEWDNAECTILRFVFSTEWTWEEFDATHAQAYELVEQTGADFGVVLEFPPIVFLPGSILDHLREQTEQADPHNRVIVIVATSSVIRTLFDVFTKLHWSTARHFRLTSTLDGARTIIREALAVSEDSHE